MTGRVKLWLKEGKVEEEILLLLQESYPVKQQHVKAEKKPAKKIQYLTANKKQALFTVLVNENITTHLRKHTAKRRYRLRE